jgi:hypothetical protein
MLVDEGPIKAFLMGTRRGDPYAVPPSSFLPFRTPAADEETTLADFTERAPARADETPLLP